MQWFDRPLAVASRTSALFSTDVSGHLPVLVSVDSSTSIAAVGYDQTERRLYIRFRNDDALYCYDEVPPTIFEALMAAPSKGQFHNRAIRHRFHGHKVV